ncbi:MAG: hypothetical protein QGH45_10095, partial [Myxococcota bacterium]|nr:hypothetical protein [Myxococcota bacterium]
MLARIPATRSTLSTLHRSLAGRAGAFDGRVEGIAAKEVHEERHPPGQPHDLPAHAWPEPEGARAAVLLVAQQGEGDVVAHRAQADLPLCQLAGHRAVVLDQHAHVLGRADQHELGALELLELDREAALVPHLIVLVEDHQQRPAPEGPLDGGAEVAEDGLDLAQRRLAPVHQQQILELPSQGGVLPAGQLRL